MKTRCQVLSVGGPLLNVAFVVVVDDEPVKVVPVKVDEKDCGVCGRLASGVEVEVDVGVALDEDMFAVVGGM